MLENAWRRLALVLVLAGLGAGFLIVNGLRLGLDLQGGTRLVYRVDIERAKKSGDLDKSADPQQVMQEMITIITKRIDPQGVKDPSITQAGSDRVLIELPGADPNESVQIQKRIQDLGALEMRMVAYDDFRDPEDRSFQFDLAEEKKRLDAWLAIEENKKLVDADPLLAIRKFNQMAGTETGPKAAKKDFRWAPMHRKKIGTNDDGTTIWRYETHRDAHPSVGPDQPSFLPLNQREKYWFTGDNLDARGIIATTDPDTSEPAIGYRMKPAASDKYADLSGRNINKHKAVILNGYVRLAPFFRSRISGSGQVSGGFSAQEVASLVIVLKTGSLRVVPQLESNTTIGPTLGQIAIEKGKWSIITGGALVVVFMLFYYKLTGIIAIAALLLNVALIFGLLSFISATLTLPGLAGIVLTIGMAVDANILIFERIREEKERGNDLARSIEAGFAKAMSTILDANITTFLTGLILYNFGIGPIKGFAVTLMLGIVCSVFSAVFFGKLLFHYLLASGSVTDLKMARLFATPNFRFLSVRKITTVISVAAVTACLAGFFSVGTNTKYGLDFTGGAAFQVALRQPMTQQELQDKLEGDTEFAEEFKNSSPQIVSTGEATGEKSNAFLVKLKLTPEKREEFQTRQNEAADRNETYNPPYIGMVKRILGDQLAYEPFGEMTSLSEPDDGKSYVATRLHSTEPLPVDAVREQIKPVVGELNTVVALGADGKKLADVKEAKDILIDYTVPSTYDEADEKAKARFQLDQQSLLQEALSKLKLGDDDRRVVLSAPFPESSLIGSRAVGDLRDAAIAAILLSLLIIVIYIRVRFHEYKYGFGACAALVHDVCITLGIVAVLNAVGIIHAEIDLSMIAAFLTIIGYSLNDTIVVFDRIRENLELQEKLGGKESFEELVDRSVNQTLSRTVLTSVTTFLVVAALFVYNYGAGSVLEGFAFSMMIGIVVGTYSSIWVANVVVVWITNREKDQPSSGDTKIASKSHEAKVKEQPEPV